MNKTSNPILAATLVAAQAPLDSIHIPHGALKAFTGFLPLYFIGYSTATLEISEPFFILSSCTARRPSHVIKELKRSGRTLAEHVRQSQTPTPPGTRTSV
ncbi:unnamed protein product [Boreogadus saida]